MERARPKRSFESSSSSEQGRQPELRQPQRRQSEPIPDRFEAPRAGRGGGRQEAVAPRERGRARDTEEAPRRVRDRDDSPRRAGDDDGRPAGGLRRTLEQADLGEDVEKETPERRVRARQQDDRDPDAMAEERPLRGQPGPLFQELEERRARNVAPQGWGEAGARVIGQGVAPTAIVATSAFPLVSTATLLGPAAALTPMTGGLALLGALGGAAAFEGSRRAINWYWNRGPEPTISAQHAQAIQDNRALLRNWSEGAPNALDNLRNGLRVLGIDVRAEREAGVGWRLQAEINPERAAIAGVNPEQVQALIDELNAAVRPH